MIDPEVAIQSFNQNNNILQNGSSTKNFIVFQILIVWPADWDYCSSIEFDLFHNI
jgi:hypothetical protein